MEAEFGCSLEVATLSLSLYVVGVAISPLFLGPLSEVRLVNLPLIFKLDIFTSSMVVDLFVSRSLLYSVALTSVRFT